jgi:hypothetical protein
MSGSTAVRPLINHILINAFQCLPSKRTINGDADKYRELATKGANYLSATSGATIGTVIVCG